MTATLLKALVAVAAFVYWIWPMLGGKRPTVRAVIEALFAGLAVFAAASVGLAALAALRTMAPERSLSTGLALAVFMLAYTAFAGLWVARLSPSAGRLPPWARRRFGAIDLALGALLVIAAAVVLFAGRLG